MVKSSIPECSSSTFAYLYVILLPLVLKNFKFGNANIKIYYNYSDEIKLKEGKKCQDNLQAEV